MLSLTSFLGTLSVDAEDPGPLAVISDSFEHVCVGQGSLFWHSVNRPLRPMDFNPFGFSSCGTIKRTDSLTASSFKQF